MKLIGLDLYADEGKWLYQGDRAARKFWRSITLAKEENAKYFHECTNEEKEQWELEYNPPMPEETTEDTQAVEQ
jgi:hypothetical protein